MNFASFENKAVKAAMNGDWAEALKLNQEVIKLAPKDIAALNRLGRAYWEIGDLKKARETLKKVLELDKYNQIALKNLKRITDSGQINKPFLAKSPRLSSRFLEEPGKTKAVKLVRLADPKVLSDLDHGETVILVPKKRSISVTREDDTYIGALPDDLSSRLIRFINGGNRYQALIKVVDRRQVEIFIREAYRNSRFKNIPSFVSGGVSYIPFLPPEAIYESRPEVAPTGEEETND